MFGQDTNPARFDEVLGIGCGVSHMISLLSNSPKTSPSMEDLKIQWEPDLGEEISDDGLMR